MESDKIIRPVKHRPFIVPSIRTKTKTSGDSKILRQWCRIGSDSTDYVNYTLRIYLYFFIDYKYKNNEILKSPLYTNTLLEFTEHIRI